MFAAHGGHARLVETLLKAGAQTELKDPSGLTALAFAVEANHTETVSAAGWRRERERRVPEIPDTIVEGRHCRQSRAGPGPACPGCGAAAAGL